MTHTPTQYTTETKFLLHEDTTYIWQSLLFNSISPPLVTTNTLIAKFDGNNIVLQKHQDYATWPLIRPRHTRFA
jgi:hypothetical protein